MISNFAALADFIGIFAFALAGILSASQAKIDPVGVFVLAFTTAFGGGIFRDTIIDNRPYYWIENESYVWLTILLAVFAPTIIAKFKTWFAPSVFIWLDAIGLSFFSVNGTALCLQAGIPALSATILGVCTGALGGMIRDVLLNRLPLFLGCWLFVGLNHFWPSADTVPHEAALWISTASIIGIRMFCWYKKLYIIDYGIFKRLAHKRRTK